MKPIKLTLKGINSFSEEQQIDFETLTKDGLFGIFGPTGSGKSTILDAITLALYGELARKSKNFIHVGCETASVSFTFSIAGKENKTYQVFRSFKIKKDSGYSVAAKARLCELSAAGNESVLEDSVSTVTKRVEALLGLKFEDFTRTVVLPQGKFSEFLKLSGSERSQMLERLFNLYEYGIALTDKVKKVSAQTEGKRQVCLAKLAEHAEETPEALEKAEKELTDCGTKLNKEQKRLKELADSAEKNRQLFEWQEELELRNAQLTDLDARQEEMAGACEKLEAAGRAAGAVTFVDQAMLAESTCRQAQKLTQEKQILLAADKEKLAQKEKAYHELRMQKEEKEHEYQEKNHLLERACEMQDTLNECIGRQKEVAQAFLEAESKALDTEQAAGKAQHEAELLKEQLTQTEERYAAHMEAAFLKRFRSQLKEEGTCPVCGREWEAHTVAEYTAAEHAENMESQSDIPDETEVKELKQQLAQKEQAASAQTEIHRQADTALALAKEKKQAADDERMEKEEALQKLFLQCGIESDPQGFRKKLEADYLALRTSCEREEKALETKKTALHELEIAAAKAQAGADEQAKNYVQAKELAVQKLAESGFADANALRACLMTQEEQAELKEELKNYEDMRSEARQQIAILEGKLEGRSVDPEAYEKEREEIENLQKAVNELIGQKAVLTNSVEELNKILPVIGALREEQEMLEKRLALLKELETLLKGKKFVEYVARERLSYVAGEASEKLQEITGGIYGLELNEAGEFFIRDYKNGGAPRNVNSLSGGEIFLVSLSLALSLSTQIQLKGTAPLEFFFLDEGFGTLDEQLLDTVMDALDALQHERRKIGIISHVESLKERVPVKLIVTPARAGEGGSRTEIVK